MKVITTLMLSAVLLGCAPLPTMDELEAEAAITGDWSKVERRQRIEWAREARESTVCPAEKMLYCVNYAVREQCGCVDRDALTSTFGGWSRY